MSAECLSAEVLSADVWLCTCVAQKLHVHVLIYTP